MTDVLSKLDVDASIVKAELEELVCTALMTSMQLLFSRGLVFTAHRVQRHLIVCSHKDKHTVASTGFTSNTSRLLQALSLD